MNKQTLKYARRYLDDFSRLFQITSEGNLSTTQENLLKIEEWFNRSYLCVSLVTGVPLSEVRFNHNIGLEHEDNLKTLIHIYSVSYTSLYHFSRVLEEDIPIQFRPTISSVQFIRQDLDE
jgi:hypothetical protein